MPDMNRFRRLGQQFTQGGQEIIKQVVDDPLDRMRAAAAVAEAQQKKIPAPQGSLSNPNFQMAIPEVPGPVGSPEFSGGDVDALEAYANLIKRDKEQREQMQLQDVMRKKQEAVDENAVYQQYHREAREMGEMGAQPARDERFSRLKRSFQPQQGAIELSQDPVEMQLQIQKARLGQ